MDASTQEQQAASLQEARSKQQKSADAQSTPRLRQFIAIRSFNALEPKLAEKPFKRLVGLAPEAAQTIAKLCSIDTISRALCVADLESARDVSREVLAKAERNKVFREGWIGGLRVLALDGGELDGAPRRQAVSTPAVVPALPRAARPSGLSSEAKRDVLGTAVVTVVLRVRERQREGLRDSGLWRRPKCPPS